MSNFPIPLNEKARLRALDNYQILDTQPQEEFDRLTKIASLVCGTPISVITLLDQDRQWFKSVVGLDATQTPRKDAFCRFTIMGDALMEIPDALADERFVQNPLVTSDPNIRFYAGYPLVDPEGYALGAFCVIDVKPNSLDDKQREILAMLADEAIAQIVERKEKVLLKNYEKLFVEAIDMICVAGKDGYFRKINPAFSKTLKWSNEQLLAEPFYSFIHPDDLADTAEAIQSRGEEQKSLNFTNRFITADGDYKCLQWIATPDLDSDNLYAIARDITAFTKIQDQLIEVSNFQEKILNGTDYSIISTNKVGLITTFNRGAELLLGYQAAEVVNQRNLVDFITRKKATGEESPTTSEAESEEGISFDTLLASNLDGSETHIWSFIRKDGHDLTVELTLSPLESDGKDTTGYLAVGKDITIRDAAQKLLETSERRHRAFFENSQSLMCTHDLKGNFLSINPAGSEMMGYTFGETLVRSLYDIVVPHHRANIDIYLKEVGEKGSLRGLMQIQDKEGETRTWMYNNVLSEFVDGRKYVIGNAVDLTARISMEQELVSAKDNAERNARAKDIFIANMSHEIRTPMNAIMGFANLLKSSCLTDEQCEYTNNIATASENLLGIINDILDLSKIESGHLAIEEIPFNLREIIKNVKAVQNQKAAEKGLTLDTVINEGVPDTVVGDPTRLNQILLNLVNNALKFTEEGSVTLTLDLLEESATEYLIQYSVSDTGIGIPEDKLATIFERFTQADSNTTRKYGGTGLGLSISKLLIELQHGTLSVTSGVGEGSTFYCTLPFRKADKNVAAKADTQPVQLISSARLRVLLVEDNVLNQRLATKVLENIGFEADLAKNGRIATEMIRETRYDVVLMDLQMPEMDGYQATEYIRNELKSEVPIIAMTAHSLVGEKDKCMSVGMNDYLPKPFLPADLFEKINNAAIRTDKQGTETIPETSRLDLSYLKEISDNSKEFETEMIELFVGQIPMEVENLGNAIQRKDHEAIRAVAHKIKSSYSMLGVQEEGLVQTLEDQGLEGASIDSIQSNYERLSAITDEVLRELDETFLNPIPAVQ